MENKGIAGGLAFVVLGVLSSVATLIMVIVILWSNALNEKGRAEVVVQLRVTNNCIALRNEGNRPPICEDVNARIDAMGRNEMPADLRN